MNSSPSEKSRALILVIEDDRSIRQVLRELLEMEGYEVETAENGLVALDQLRHAERLPDLILLDLMMPLMDGWEFRDEQARDERLSGIPVLVMTADGQAGARVESIGTQGLIRKPIEIDEFLETIQAISA